MESTIESSKARYIEILRDNGINDEFTKVEIIVPELHGDHFASSCDYVTVHRKSGEPIHMFVKRLVENPAYKEMLVELKVFDKEAGFFNEILPELKRFVQSRIGPNEEYNLDIGPKCYFADDRTTVMENLVKRGYVLLDKLKKQDLNQARMVLKNLARFHAPSYVLIKEEISSTDLLSKFPILEDTFLVEGGPKLLNEWLPSSFEITKKILKANPGVNGEANQKILNELSVTSMAKLQSYFRMSETDVCHVINHGDCWNNNMMFLQDPKTKELVGHVFVDFQVVRVGSPNLDIGYYLFTSVQHDVRQKEWKNLLKFYYDSLVENVAALKGNVDFSFEEFLADYKIKFVPGFAFGLLAEANMAGMSDAGNLDEIEGDAIAHIQAGVEKWLENNPEMVKKKSDVLSVHFDEYREVLNLN